MLGIVIGILAVGLGIKAFTPTGLPLTRTKNLTGTGAKILGVLCILVGAAFLLDGIYSMYILMGGTRTGR